MLSAATFHNRPPYRSCLVETEILHLPHTVSSFARVRPIPVVGAKVSCLRCSDERDICEIRRPQVVPQRLASPSRQCGRRANALRRLLCRSHRCRGLHTDVLHTLSKERARARFLAGRADFSFFSMWRPLRRSLRPHHRTGAAERSRSLDSRLTVHRATHRSRINVEHHGITAQDRGSFGRRQTPFGTAN